MRRFKECRSLAAIALSQRSFPCPCRSYSAGIGRGRGFGDRSAPSEENPSHSIPAGRGRGRGVGGGVGGFFNPSFLGAEKIEPKEEEEEEEGEKTSFSNVGPGQIPIPSPSTRRGSPLQRRAQDDANDDDFVERKGAPMSSRMPSLGLQFGGFGRGKIVQETSFRSSEELLSSDQGRIISKWSKWDEKTVKTDLKEDASPEELRLMGDAEAAINVLRHPTPVMQSKRMDRAQHGWQQPIDQTQGNVEKEMPPLPNTAQTQDTSSRVNPFLRGEGMGSLLNLNLSQSSAFSGDAKYGGGTSQAGVENKVENADDYSQTFKPVIQPGWYAFAPDKSAPGPGLGRGQPTSLQARSPGIGSTAFSPDEVESVNEQGRSSYSQRMEAALQRSSPRYSRDSALDPRYDYPEEPTRPPLNEEDAAKRAMDILNARLSRRYGRMEDWSRDGDGDANDDDAKIRRRFPAQLSRVSRERKEPRKQIEELEAAQRKAQLSEEDAKKEAERLKAMEKNEAIEKLQDMWDQFIKSYGEMLLEPEHELGDFTNPDIDEKPMMPLEEYLEKAKPDVMKTGLFTEKQWRRMVDGVLQNQSYFEEVVEKYSGPGRYTAKQENEDLEEIASTLPSDVGQAAQAFVQRSLTTLKSNPGFNLDEKQWMLAAMVDEFSQYPMTT